MAHCIFNSKKSGMCENIISNQYIYGDSNSLSKSDRLISLFELYLPLYDKGLSEGCLTILKELYCHYLFPLCDTSLKKPHPQQICRKTCKFARYVRCKKEFDMLEKIRDPSFDQDLINCTTFSSAVGGEAPECYQHHLLPGE